MSPLQIKRHRYTDVDPKQALRTHIEHLSPEIQREFIASALQLMAKRPAGTKAKVSRFLS